MFINIAALSCTFIFGLAHAQSTGISKPASQVCNTDNSVGNSKDIEDAAQAALFHYDPTKQKDCSPEAKNPNANLNDGKVCYRKVFLGNAVSYLSKSLQDFKFDPKGASKTIRLNHCDIEITYYGTDASKYEKMSSYKNIDTFKYVEVKIKSKKAYGAEGEGVDTIRSGISLSGNFSYVKGPAETNEKLFNETFHNSFSTYKEVKEQDDFKIEYGKQLMQNLAKNGFDDCADKISEK